MPLKRAVLPLLDETSEQVAATGVANTVLFRDGRRHGDNTDVPGIVAALRESGVERVGAPRIHASDRGGCGDDAQCPT